MKSMNISLLYLAVFATALPQVALDCNRCRGLACIMMMGPDGKPVSEPSIYRVVSFLTLLQTACQVELSVCAEQCTPEP